MKSWTRFEWYSWKTAISNPPVCVWLTAVSRLSCPQVVSKIMQLKNFFKYYFVLTLGKYTSYFIASGELFLLSWARRHVPQTFAVDQTCAIDSLWLTDVTTQWRRQWLEQSVKGAGNCSQRTCSDPLPIWPPPSLSETCTHFQRGPSRFKRPHSAFSALTSSSQAVGWSTVI